MTAAPPFLDEGAGRAIVFLHGWTMDGSIFANQFRRLAARYRCLAPDLPGHGRNRSNDISIDGAVQAVRALFEKENLSDAILVGWSLGAAIGWHYLSNHEIGRVAGMISVDMSPKLINEAGWRLGLQGRDRAACLATTAQFRNHWNACGPAIAAGMFGSAAGSADLPLDGAVERIAANDPAAMVAMWESLLTSDARELIAALPAPLLVAHGRFSKVYGAATARWLTKTAPKARSVEFAHSGHSPHLEEPDDFASALGTFCETV